MLLGKIFNALEKADQNKTSNEGAESNSFNTVETDELISNIEPVPDQDISLAPPPQHDKEKLVTISKPYSAVSEQFRLLKNNILFPEKGQPPRTIMITSASPGEGKSFVSANLAAIMAQSIDEYVLLMDCDLRKPTIHKVFGFDGKNIKGLSDYLSNGTPLSGALKKTSINKLTILPAGRIPRNPSELLSSEQMKRMLHEVKLRYNDRYIIIDTPPPYITSETNAIARHVDGIVIVIRQGKTRMKEVQDIVDIYGKEKIIGVIKNFSTKLVGYGYGYHKYGYGYNHNNE